MRTENGVLEGLLFFRLVTERRISKITNAMGEIFQKTTKKDQTFVGLVLMGGVGGYAT